MQLSMNTNAGARDSEWWESLAKVLGKNGYVIFSVDGLEETNPCIDKMYNGTKLKCNEESRAGGRA